MKRFSAHRESATVKSQLRAKYIEKDRQVKRSTKADKRK